MFEAFDEILDACGKFAAREIVPGVLDADLNPNPEWLKTLRARSREVGLPGLLLPEELNGAGQPEACAALVLDALASACAGFASVLAFHLTVCSLALQAEERKRTPLLSLLARPDQASLAAVVLPAAGEENRIVACRDDGAVRIQGTSALSGSAEVADLFLVFARQEGHEEGTVCLVVDRACEGLSVGENAELPGLRVNAFAELAFDRVQLGPEDVLFEGPPAAQALAKAQRLLHSFVAAMSMGVSRAAFQKAYAYAGERYQFGKMIIRHQEIQRMLGEMLAKLQAGTAAYFHLFSGEKCGLPLSAANSGLVKAFCTDAALAIVTDAIQIHGGYGYMHEYGMEKRMRDAKVLQLLGGSGPWLEVEAIAQTLGSG